MIIGISFLLYIVKGSYLNLGSISYDDSLNSTTMYPVERKPKLRIVLKKIQLKTLLMLNYVYC